MKERGSNPLPPTNKKKRHATAEAASRINIFLTRSH